MSEARRPAIATSAAEIVRHWRQRESECGLSVDWADASKRCWRCSRKTRLQKCHIVPHSLGGPDSADNLILLCARCHQEAPNVSDSTFMWTWLRRYAVTFYDTDWIARGFEEYERIFGRKPFANVAKFVPEAAIIDAVKNYRRRAIIHFGAGRPNPSTMAWVISQIEMKLLSKGTKS